MRSILTTILLIVLLVPLSIMAQEDDGACTIFLGEESQVDCSEAETNTVCHISSAVITMDENLVEGDAITALDSVHSIATTSSDEVQSSAKIKRDNWTANLVGDTRLTFVGTTQIVVSVAVPDEINVINVKSIPSGGAALVTTLEPNTELIADGRNAAGDWLRVQLPDEGGVGWIVSFLLASEDDMNTLPVLEGDELTYDRWDAWQVQTAFGDDPSCFEKSHGILLQSQNGIVNIQINGADLSFDGTVYIEARVEEQRLRVTVLEGAAELAYMDNSQDAMAGLTLSVGLNEDAQAVDGTISLQSLEFATFLPLNLLERPIEMPEALPVDK